MDSLPPKEVFSSAFTYIVFLTIIGVLFSLEQNQITCHNPYKFLNSVNFSACDDLPVLDSSIHWNYHFPSNSIDMAFKNNNVKHNQWIAWAINPNSTGTEGSQAFVAFKKSDGTMAAYTSPITTYGTRLDKGNLSFKVYTVSASFKHGMMIIYAKFQLPGNSTMVNHIWQRGFVFQDTLHIHATKGDNLKSFGQLDFLEASYYPVKGNPTITSLRKVGGILSGIGWGILMPVGIMMARYLKEFEATKSAWFHLHWICLILAYVIAIAGCGVIIISMGIKQFLDTYYYTLGSIQFFFCSLLILVAYLSLIRSRQGHNDISLFNLCHCILGYGAMYSAMMGGGFSIPKRTYVGIIVSLACVAAILEFLLYRIHTKKQEHLEISTHGNSQIP